MKDSLKKKQVLIFGAGGAGSFVVRAMQENRMAYLPVGFIDDDPRLEGRIVGGLPVLGMRRDLPSLVKKHFIEEILIAIPSAPPAILREIIAISRGTGAKVKIIPSIRKIITGEICFDQVRDIQVEDLLQREPVEADLTKIAGYLSGKKILVTGAGGSIGSELCRQIASFVPAQLILMGHGENSIYDIWTELREKHPQIELQPEIADIQDKIKMGIVFSRYRPDVVFHAAAHKHVPFLEIHPDEGIKNNVIGTMNVAEAASQWGSGTFILISSDKAVNPVNILGATKKIAEIIVLWMNAKSRTHFAVTRFGNVLGSRGSVIPLFKKQISLGGPLTVTHPEMVRFFMTISEAAQLVIQAGALAQGGEVFVLDMGTPVKIIDLARDLTILSGKEPGKEIEIKITGSRPGEKLVEELMTEEEKRNAKYHQKLFITVPGITNDAKIKEFLKILKYKPIPYDYEKIVKLVEIVIPQFSEGQNLRKQGSDNMTNNLEQNGLIQKIERHLANIAVIGLGYVGLPLAVESAKAGFRVIGVDRDKKRVDKVNSGENYLPDIDEKELQQVVTSKNLVATEDFFSLRDADVIVICVPTPLTNRKEPDISFLEDALNETASYLQPGKLIIVESTSYPGTTDELVVPKIKNMGLSPGKDVYIAYAPERIDPGNPQFFTRNIPKVVGGVTTQCCDVAVAFYRQVLEQVIPVSSPAVAEMTKLLENTYRSVNIALINEMMLLCDRMNIDIWEVVEAAGTKPFGIQTFYPGPGVGGHCIAVDPFYLSWKAKEYDFHIGFVEWAGRINSAVHQYVASKVAAVLNEKGKCLNGSRILVIGVAYKKDTADCRESPALAIMAKLKAAHAEVCYYDPYVSQVVFSENDVLNNITLTEDEIAKADCVLIITDHTVIDYTYLVEQAQLIVDTRNATKMVPKGREKIIRI